MKGVRNLAGRNWTSCKGYYSGVSLRLEPRHVDYAPNCFLKLALQALWRLMIAMSKLALQTAQAYVWLYR